MASEGQSSLSQLNENLNASKQPNDKEPNDITNSNNNLATIIPKCCVWTMVASGGSSVPYPFTICELAGATELVNNYGQYFGALTEQQVYEYARNLGNVGVYGSVADVPRPEAAATQEPRPAPAAAAAAAAAADDEDDANNRDWLDWFGMVIRALILFSFLYVNGSLHRLFLVICFYFLIKYYLRHQNDVENNNVNPPERQPRQDANQQQPAEQQTDDDPAHLQRLMDDNINENHSDPHSSSTTTTTSDMPTNSSSNVPSVGVFLSLLKALFTSLIPNPTPQLNGDRA